MIRTHPARTALFSAGPILFGLFQFFNSYLHDGSLLVAVALCGIMAAFSAMVTRYHLVTFRISQLNKNVDRPE